MADRESGNPAEGRDGGIAKAFYDNPSKPPQDVRPPPGEPVRRSSPDFGPERGGASAKHFVARASTQSREAVRDRQSVNQPGHAPGPAPSRPQTNGPRR